MNDFITNFDIFVKGLDKCLPPEVSLWKEKMAISIMDDEAILNTFMETFEPYKDYIKKSDDSFIQNIDNSLMNNYHLLGEEDKKMCFAHVYNLLKWGKRARLKINL